MTPGYKFKQIIQADGYVFTGGIYDPLSAKVAAMAGMKALYLSGYSQSLALLGKSDLEFVQREQTVDNARRICEALEFVHNIPLIADIDTGYGSIPQVQLTVKQMEKAGVAGIHIEDQTIPKRCGHIAGKKVLPLEESVGKVRAAVDAKKDEDFVIIARTDALGAVGGSMEDAVARGLAYWDAGADFLWCEFGSSSLALAKEFSEKVRKVSSDAQFAFNYSSSFKDWHTNQVTFPDLVALGYKYIFVTLYGLHAATLALYDWFAELHSHREKAQWNMEIIKRGHPTESHHVLGDTAYYQALEKKYLPEAAKEIEKSEGYKEESICH